MERHSQQPYVLKVFSGPHLGAEILLGDGEHVIGSDDDADIILHDQLIAPRHARVLIAGDHISCRSEGNAGLLLDGRPCHEAVVVPFQLFTLGNTHLAIGPGGSPWPAMEFPDFTLKSSLVPAPEENETAAEMVPDTLPPERSPGILRFPRYGRYVAAAAAVVVLVSAMCYGMLSEERVAPPIKPLNLADVEQKLATAVAKHAPNAIVHAAKDNDAILVTGYVDTPEQCQALEQALSTSFPSVHLRLWTSDQLVRSTRTVLEASGLSLDVTKGTPGEVILRGRMRDAARLEILLNRIRRDVPPIRQLTSLVQTSKDAPESSPEVAVAESASPPPVTKEKPSGHSATMTLDVAGVNLGAYQWVVLPDGKRVFPGAVLNNGYLVKTISPEGVVLSKNSGSRRPLTGDRE